MKETTKASLALSLLLSLAPLMSFANSVSTSYLVERKQEKMKCSLPEETMQELIANAGETRGWTVLEQIPGKTHVQYIKGNNKHILRLNVIYSANTFRILYESSEGLDYYVIEEKSTSNDLRATGARRIHSAALRWMANLNKDIKKASKQACNELKAKQN